MLFWKSYETRSKRKSPDEYVGNACAWKINKRFWNHVRFKNILDYLYELESPHFSPWMLLSWTKSRYPIPKKRKFNFRLAFGGLKLLPSFLSLILTNKSYLLNKYSNFKIIVWLNFMHNTVETVDRLCQEASTFVRALW